MSKRRRHLMELTWIKRLPTGWMLVLIVLISFSVALFWVWLGPALADQAGLSEPQWLRLDALTTAATFALGLGAGVVVLIELSEATASRNSELYRDIYEKLMAAEQIEVRRYIYQEMPWSEDPTEMAVAVAQDPVARKNLKDILNLLDYFGFLVEQSWVTADDVLGWLSPVVVKVWARIGPLVEYELGQRPEEPDYYQSARKLARLCQQWREKNLPGRQKAITFDKRRL